MKVRTLRLYIKDLLRCFLPEQNIHTFIQVGEVGGSEDDLLDDPVGGQVTKLI